jgi:hypothetical protein
MLILIFCRMELLQGGGAERGKLKNPPRQRMRGGLKINAIENSSGSLAVFYVEQVALNRHVSSSKALPFSHIRAALSRSFGFR